MTIKVLDSRVIAQIAAGEVVERPASVVKELVENSLDAGATQINVEIREGGTGLVRVIDNGCGIPPDEVAVAFERHATSKIGSLTDLENLHTLGFRGEALPSIAAVARVEILTAAGDQSGGSYLEWDSGRLLHQEKQARPTGTTISVYNLFRKIPARLKFLKSAQAEGGRVADIITQYALAYPEVRFTFVNESRTQLRTPGSGQLVDAVAAVYGVEAARQMIDLTPAEPGFQTGPVDIKVNGLVGSPQLTRATRDYLHFFVNRRWVNNRLLGFAVEEAYHGLLMQGRHPLAVINLKLPPQEIDVNVHPAKTEIKFQDERGVFAALQKAVRGRLVQSAPVHDVGESTAQFVTPTEPFSAVPPVVAAAPNLPWTKPSGSNTSSTPADAPTPLISLPLLRVLGQLAAVYIAAEGPDGLYLIDQHAAHERIMLEKIAQQRASHKVEKQGLLPAATLEIEPRLAAVLNQHLELLGEMGFEIEAFGPGTYLLRTIPAVLSGRNYSAALREALETQAADWSENLLNRLACHSAIRAGQILNLDEMKELIRQLEKVALPNSCPHGRPTMIRLTLAQIEKEFGRLG